MAFVQNYQVVTVSVVVVVVDFVEDEEQVEEENIKRKMK